MKLNDLVKHLQKIQEKEGNIPVKLGVWTEWYGLEYEDIDEYDVVNRKDLKVVRIG